MEPNVLNTFLLAFESSDLDVEVHQHSAYQLVFANDSSFKSKIGGKQESDLIGFLIAPNVPHKCSEIKGKVTICNVETDSYLGVRLGDFLNPGCQSLLFRTYEELEQKFNAKWDGSPSFLFAPREKTDSVLLQRMDVRVKTIMDIIRAHPDGQIQLKNLSDQVFLSPSRLSALFREHTGSSISKFMLWTRVKLAIKMLLEDQDKSIRDIALETGFYDSPNFTKVLYRAIGVKPSVLRENSNLIQLWG